MFDHSAAGNAGLTRATMETWPWPDPSAYRNADQAIAASRMTDAARTASASCSFTPTRCARKIQASQLVQPAAGPHLRRAEEAARRQPGARDRHPAQEVHSRSDPHADHRRHQSCATLPQLPKVLTQGGMGARSTAITSIRQTIDGTTNGSGTVQWHMDAQTEHVKRSGRPGSNFAQWALLQCPVFEVFFGGARGGGKTDGMLGDWMLHANQLRRAMPPG